MNSVYNKINYHIVNIIIYIKRFIIKFKCRIVNIITHSTRINMTRRLIL